MSEILRIVFREKGRAKHAHSGIEMMEDVWRPGGHCRDCLRAREVTVHPRPADQFTNCTDNYDGTYGAWCQRCGERTSSCPDPMRWLIEHEPDCPKR